MYYQKQMCLAMSRESGLDRISEEDSMSGSHRVRRRRAAYRVDSQDSRDSVASRDSISRFDVTEIGGISPFSVYGSPTYSPHVPYSIK